MSPELLFLLDVFSHKSCTFEFAGGGIGPAFLFAQLLVMHSVKCFFFLFQSLCKFTMQQLFKRGLC